MNTIESITIGPRPRLRVLHSGQGAPCLFLHGIGGNALNWHRQLETFGRSFHALAWDVRGYGESEDYEGPFRLEDVSQDILRVLDHFSYDRAHIVGLSMGGLIAFDFYTRFPESVLSLTICSATIGTDALPPEAVQEFLSVRQAPLLSGKEPYDIAEPVAEGLLGSSVSNEVRQELIESIKALRKDSYLKTLEAVAHHRIDLAPESITAPVHLVAAGEDKLITRDDMAYLAARIKQARFTVIEGAGHVSNIEKPDEFNDAILEFLHELSPDEKAGRTGCRVTISGQGRQE
ncbi:MAG: alpha/beta hydrolase [Haliea sp.]